MVSQAALPGIALGISIGLIASFIQSLGLTVQRKSHVQNEKLPEAQQKPDYRRPLWLLGFTVFISSNLVGSLVQIAALPVVILGPLGAISLLWNALLACFLLGDQFSIWMIAGSILIAGGAVLIALFGLVPETTHSLDDLLELFRRPTFIVYFSLLGVFVGIILLATHFTEWSLHRRLAAAGAQTPPLSPTTHAANPSGLTTGVADTIAEATTTERTPLLDRKVLAPPQKGYTPSMKSLPDTVKRTRMFLALAYAASSGILSGMCLLFAKSGVELIILTLGGKNQFWRWEAWVLVLGLVVFALLQLWYLHKALVLADPTLVCPSAFCFYNVSCIVNGLVYFDQFSQIPWLNLFLVAVGMVVLLGGVWVISIQAAEGRPEPESWSLDGSDCGSPEDEETSYLAETIDLELGQERPSLAGSTSSTTRPSQSEPLLSVQSETPRRSRPPRIHVPGTAHERRASDGANVLLSSPVHSGWRREASGQYGSHPLSPPLGGGLQIGLAPVSTDFALLVAARRRRKTSGMSSFSNDLPEEDGPRGRVRRSVSEGGVSQGDVDEEQTLVNSAEGVEDHPEETPHTRRKLPHPWGWAKGLFTRR